MQPPAGPVEWVGYENLGRFWLDLYTDHSWILRRVEGVTLLDLVRVERRTTLDIDVQRITELAEKHELTDKQSLVIPLALLDKNLLLDVDVSDEVGSTLPICVSDRDASAAALLMLAYLEHSHDMLGIPRAIQQKLYDIAKGNPSIEDRKTLTLSAAGEIEQWGLGASLMVGQDAVDKWLSLFDDRKFSDLVVAFTLQYMLMVPLRLPDQRSVRILKFRIVEASGELTPERSWLERAGISPFSYLIEAPTVGRAGRETSDYLRRPVRSSIVPRSSKPVLMNLRPLAKPCRQNLPVST